MSATSVWRPPAPAAGVLAKTTDSLGTAVIATGGQFGVKATGHFAVHGTSNSVSGGLAIGGTAHGAGVKGVLGTATGTRSIGVQGDAGADGLGGSFSGGRAPIRLFPGAEQRRPKGCRRPSDR